MTREEAAVFLNKVADLADRHGLAFNGGFAQGSGVFNMVAWEPEPGEWDPGIRRTCTKKPLGQLGPKE